MHTVEVLGPGCRNCERLTSLTDQALTELGRPERVEKVTDPVDIVARGVFSTPALVIDGELVIAARIPTLASLRDMLTGRLV